MLHHFFSRSPMALSINEEGEEFYEDGLFNEKLFNEKPTTAGANPPLLVDKSPASVPEHEICRNVLQHQRSSRPYGLRRQVSYFTYFSLNSEIWRQNHSVGKLHQIVKGPYFLSEGGTM